MCKHETVYIHEEYLAKGSHEFQRGEYQGSWNDDSRADLTGYIEVECVNCGYNHRFRPKEHKPKWLKSLMDKISQLEA